MYIIFPTISGSGDDAAYRKLKCGNNPFSSAYRPYIVAALISFDMARMMGSGVEQKYDIKMKGFASKLNQKFNEVQPYLKLMIKNKISEWDENEYSQKLMPAYNILSQGGETGLNQAGNKFHVATKILHFLNPSLFPIVDSNAATALRELHYVPYKKSTQPGYSAKLYSESISVIQLIVANYGYDRFQNLEPETPIMRIFDKLTFSYGKSW